MSNRTGRSRMASLLAMLGLLLSRLRPGRATALLLAVATLGAGARSAHGQLATGFTLERFRIATDRQGVLDVEWGGTLLRGQWDLGLWVGAADDPLVVVQQVGGERLGRLVDHRVGGHLVATMGVLDVLQAGLELPIILSQDQSLGASPVGVAGDLSRLGVGDLRVVPKLGLLRAARHGVDLAVIPAATFPSSTADHYFGDPRPAFAPEVAISRALGAVRLAANVGYRTRKLTRAGSLEIDDEIFGRLGAGYRFGASGGPPVEVDLTLAAATRASDFLGRANNDYAELHAGLQYLFGQAALGFVAAGAGLSEGFGAPDVRVLVGARYGTTRRAPARPAPRADRDGDGVPDDEDACPSKAENRNGFEDADGCPDDPDSDGDGLADSVDACPGQPEDAGAFEDADGCPEPDGDSDGDGLADGEDACPGQPEDVDAFEDQDGCPDPDNDGDAVLDPDDACPGEAGPASNRGCPDPDRDGDGVLDRLDNCPDEAGDPANQGCRQQQLVAIKEGRLELVDRVYFRSDRDAIQRRSFALLDNVAAVLTAHPGVRVRISGHTDDRGDDAYNKQLSQRRAEQVMRYLIEKGVDAGRLEAVGHGEEKPLQGNDTAAGRAANRRVEFDIIGAAGAIQQDGAATGDAPGALDEQGSGPAGDAPGALDEQGRGPAEDAPGDAGD